MDEVEKKALAFIKENCFLEKGETVIVQGTHKTMPGATVDPRSAGKKK